MIFDTVKNLMQETGWGKPKEINHYTFTGMLICSDCGSVFYRIVNRRGNAYWVCKKHKHKAADCPSVLVSEISVQDAFIRVMVRLKTGGSIATYKERIKQEFREDNLQEITELKQSVSFLRKRRGLPYLSQRYNLAKTAEIRDFRCNMNIVLQSTIVG
jgi:hypothetical protein